MDHSMRKTIHDELYKALDIPLNASGQGIRRGFHKIAKNQSPDKHLNHPQWKAINERFAYFVFAYEILKNPETKRIYDCKGFKGLKMAGVRVPAGFENFKDPLSNSEDDDDDGSDEENDRESKARRLERLKARLLLEMKLLEEHWTRRAQERILIRRLEEEAKHKLQFATYKQIIQFAWKKEILNDRQKLYAKYSRKF